MIQSSSLKLKKCYEDHSFVFDLDDTIFYEKDYVISGFNSISRSLFKKKQVNQKFDSLINLYNDLDDPFKEFCKQNIGIKKNKLIKIMREHSPKIKTRPGFKNLIKLLKENGNEIGIITNGRTKTQRNKFHSLGLHNLVDLLIISSEVKIEKPNIRIFDLYKNKSRSEKFIFFGNNPRLDIIPLKNKECWKTVFCKSNPKMLKKYYNVNSDLEISSFMDKSLYNEFFIK